jgi:hypothetical protein
VYRFSFHSDAEVLASASGKEIRLKPTNKAFNVSELEKLELKNLDFSEACKSQDIEGIYEGVISYKEDIKEIEPYYADFFKKRLTLRGKEYEEKNVECPKNILPLGFDYNEKGKLLFTMSAGGFVFDYRLEHKLGLADSKVVDIINRKKEVRSIEDDVKIFLKDTGLKFNVEFVPFSKQFYKSDTNGAWEYCFIASYKGGSFDETYIEDKKLNGFPLPLSLRVADYPECREIGVNIGTEKIKITKTLDKVITIKDAAKLLSSKITDHKTYKVTSYGLAYLQTSDNLQTKEDKKNNVYKVRFKPYWAFYVNKCIDHGIVGYVDVQTGEVIFVNKSM